MPDHVPGRREVPTRCVKFDGNVIDYASPSIDIIRKTKGPEAGPAGRKLHVFASKAIEHIHRPLINAIAVNAAVEIDSDDSIPFKHEANTAELSLPVVGRASVIKRPPR